MPSGEIEKVNAISRLHAALEPKVRALPAILRYKRARPAPVVRLHWACKFELQGGERYIAPPASLTAGMHRGVCPGRRERCALARGAQGEEIPRSCPHGAPVGRQNLTHSIRCSTTPRVAHSFPAVRLASPARQADLPPDRKERAAVLRRVKAGTLQVREAQTPHSPELRFQMQLHLRAPL